MAVNLALNKTAAQSSTHPSYGAVAARAVDGNTSGNWANNSVTHTNVEPQPWWQVDLGNVQNIATIKLWNRTDCCWDRLTNFYVFVSDVPFTATGNNSVNATLSQAGVSSYYFNGQAGSPSSVPIYRMGRYVRVQLTATNPLSLAEVEVLGQPADATANLALNKTARQTSLDWGGVSGRASAQYSKDQAPGSLAANIPDALNVSYDYLASGDKTRVWHANVDFGMGNEVLGYDSEGRLSNRSQTFPGRESHPLLTNYLYDSLNRVWQVTYPAQYGADDLRKVIEQTYDLGSRLDSLKYDGANYLSNPVYNAESQAESMQIGAQVKEYFTYDAASGLLTEQKLRQGLDTSSPLLLHLSYNYTLSHNPGNSGAKTGRLTGITDNLNGSRHRAFVYDGIGRLKEAKGGWNAFSATPDWQQTYQYDRYGNRTSVSKTGTIPLDAGNATVTSGAASFALTYNDPVDGVPLTNRITTTVGANSYEYDPAGNQTFGQTDDQTWQRYQFDTAGRLAQVSDASGNPVETYSYGGSSQRLKTVAGSNERYYAWEGGGVLMEFTNGAGTSLLWDKSYVQAGGRLVATA